MVNHVPVHSDDDDDELMLRLSSTSHDPDDQLHSNGSASANHGSRSTSPTDEEELELALALSQLRSNDFDEQVALLRSNGSAPASEKAHSSTPPNENDDTDLELALNMSQLPADVFDEYAGELNQQRVPPAATEDNLTSLLAALSLGEGGTQGDLDSLLEEALSNLHDDYSEALELAEHGASMGERYESSGVLADLEEGINALSNAVGFLPENHPRKAQCIADLGRCYMIRYKRLGNVSDLNDTITAQQQAARLVPDGHPDRLGYLGHLATSLDTRFQRLDRITDLDDAITTYQQAARLIPDGHPGRYLIAYKLGNSFQSRFRRLGNLADLEEAITEKQQAVRLTPVGHPMRHGCLTGLGNALGFRFTRMGNIADSDDAITAHQQAIHLISDAHVDKPDVLNNLGTAFQNRFDWLGSVVDIDEAIAAARQAVHLARNDHPNRFSFLNNLGISCFRRFERLDNIADVNDAITSQQQAVCLAPDYHPEKPDFLNNLGTSLFRRFERLGNVADVNDAIVAHQEAIRLTPEGHPRKPGCLANLGSSFISRFKGLRNVADVDNAIIVQQQAVWLTPDGHPNTPISLSNLGYSFYRRFQHLGNIADLDAAIATLQRAVHLIPDDHSEQPTCLNNLGTFLCARLTRQPDDTTLAQAINTFSQSAKSASGPPIHRFAAAKRWAALCGTIHSNEALDAYSTLIDLLPRIVWLGRTIEERYKDISNVGNAVTDAAATAIGFGKFNLALEWLEQGRSIVWGQMLQLRTPLDELHRRHPEQADELEKISRELDSAGVSSYDQSRLPSSDDASQTLDGAARAHRRLADGYDRILARIRNLPDFNNFLQPAKSSYLCGAATVGPVVVVNVQQTRCDALVVMPHSSQVSHVPLPGLQVSVVKDLQLQLVGLARGINRIQRHFATDGDVDTEVTEGAGFSGVLGRLWQHMVEPILSYLKLLRNPVGGTKPHVTWCLTGLLTFLPAHAAGLYDTENQPKIFDYVVSSYTPTLTALLNSGRRPLKSSQHIRMLTVSQPATPGQNRLPGTTDELNAIESLPKLTGGFHVTRLDDREATVAAVLQHMKQCSWIHLACHGIQDAVNPTNSAFILIDNRLTLKEIMKQSLSHTRLAVLSACQTAKGDSELPEEAIHLAAGMLMAGYWGVVGTMWSIRDDDAPIIAEKFYEYLIGKASGDSGRAAYALHDATAHLRNVRGEKNFASWVPFIYLGICSPDCPLPE